MIRCQFFVQNFCLHLQSCPITVLAHISVELDIECQPRIHSDACLVVFLIALIPIVFKRSLKKWQSAVELAMFVQKAIGLGLLPFEQSLLVKSMGSPEVGSRFP